MNLKANIPFIDAHSHLHGLPYDAWETIGSTGIVATVLSAGNPHVHREIHVDPPDFEDVMRYWEEPIRLAASAEQKHFFKAYVALGISMMTKVVDWERAVDCLPEFFHDPNVIAVGETGIDPVQYFGMQWDLEEQKLALEAQVKVAKQLNVPLILHTPTKKNQKDYLTQGKLAFSGAPTDNYKLYFLEMDLEVINKVGLDHRLLVVDHVDESILEFVLKETNAYIGIGVGQTMRHTNPKFFAEVIDQYGPNRIMINTDYIAYISDDFLAIPKAIREMLRRGIDPDSVQRAVFANANEFYRLGLTIEN